MRNPVARAAGAAALLLLAACGGGSRRAAQPADPARTGPPPTPVAAPAIFGLFGEREELGLTSDQINRLEAIATGLRERNDSLESRLRELDRNRGRPQNMREQQRRLGEALPTLERVWANNRRANEEVGEVLTQAQRDRVCAQQRERAGERNGVAAMPMERQPMSPTEANAVISQSIRGWTWCPIGGGRTRTAPAAPSAPATPATPAPTPAPAPNPTPTPPPSAGR